jgi:transposase-like protein
MAKGNRSGVGSVRRSPAEGQALVERWRQSGLSVGEYCRKHAVGEHVLRYWLDKSEGRDRASAKASDFFVVATSDEDARSGQASSVAKPSDQAIVIVVPLAGDARGLEQTLRAVMREVRQ